MGKISRAVEGGELPVTDAGIIMAFKGFCFLYLLSPRARLYPNFGDIGDDPWRTDLGAAQQIRSTESEGCEILGVIAIAHVRSREGIPPCTLYIPPTTNSGLYRERAPRS